MRLVNHKRNALEPRATPAHLGRGSRAQPVEGFAWDPKVLQAYSAAVAADGAGGRMLMITDDGLGDHGENHLGPTSIPTITASLGTDHRPRTDTGPTERVGTSGPEEAP